jgi:hypothetical protein
MGDEYLLHLADDEKPALAALLRRSIDGDRFPLSPRIGVLRSILTRLEGRRPPPVSFPALRRYAPPRHSAARRRARR